MPISFRPQAALALAGLAILLAVLATSVTSRGGSPVPTVQAGSTYAEAMVGAPRLINPLLATSDTDRDLSHLIFSGLTRIDEHGEIAPNLADSWQISPNNLIYTFTLKPDLHWHDGEPLTSDDVYFTVGLLKSPDFHGDPGVAAPWLDVQTPITSTQQIVQFALSAPNSAFLQYTTLGIVPKHLWGNVKPGDLATSTLNSSPVGSGSWRIARANAPSQKGSNASDIPGTPVVGEVTTGDGVLLEPYPVNSGPIARLWFRPYPSFGAALAGFKTGEVHGLGHIPEERLAEVAAVPDANLHRQVLARYSMLLLNTRSPLFDKPETREALELAIDRDAVVARSLNGDARVARSPMLPQSWAYDPSLPYRGYDPATSQKLLNQAGWVVGPDGVRARSGMTMTVVLAANEDVPANKTVTQQIATYLRAVGVDVKVALVPRETLLRDYLRSRAFHIVLASWEAQGADPDVFQYWHSSQANRTGGLNFSLWANPQADAALQAARVTNDKAERKKQYADFQKVFSLDVPAVILYSPLYTYATRPPASNISLPSVEMKDPAERFDTIESWALGR